MTNDKNKMPDKIWAFTNEDTGRSWMAKSVADGNSEIVSDFYIRLDKLEPIREALDTVLADYQSSYDMQAVVSAVTGKTHVDRMEAGVRCDTILMPRIRLIREALEILNSLK